jgi:hypothetical protein
MPRARGGSAVALVEAAEPKPGKRGPYKLHRVNIWRLLQIFGAACLVMVMLTHVAERFDLFPGMGWGLPYSPGHYFDLVGAILGCILLPLGFLGAAFVRRKNSN